MEDHPNFGGFHFVQRLPISNVWQKNSPEGCVTDLAFEY